MAPRNSLYPAEEEKKECSSITDSYEVAEVYGTPFRFEPIAICGYSYRLPGGLQDDSALWDLLEGREYIQESVGQRYGEGEVPYDGQKGPFRVVSEYEGLITDGEELEFDCELFGINMNEAKRMDPQIKMMLSCTWEALQHAGMDQAALNNSMTGVFIGHQDSSITSWRAPMGTTQYDVPGKAGSMIANRISFHFNWMGPSYSVATACSSGLTALDTAVQNLQNGKCDMAACGAVSYLGALVSSIAFSALGVISPTGSSRSFDKDPNGYMRAEGAFIYILKRLRDAERDGDRIFGVIRGCALNTAGAEDGADVLTQGRMILAPVGHAQESLMKTVAAQAQIDPTQVDYMEAHATGTSVGDAIEGNAIANAYGSKNRPSKLRLASIRSNLGHMEGASFTCSLLKVLLMLQRRKFLPISSHYKEPNPSIPFEAANMRVITEVEDFPERDEPVLVGINSFGFGGANGHCLIEEYRQNNIWSKLPGELQGKVFSIPFSAKTDDALVENALRLAEKIDDIQDEVDLYTLAANLSVRTTHLRVRTAFQASTMEDLRLQLMKLSTQVEQQQVKLDKFTKPMTKKVMVFPGQGSQWAGMGKTLYETEIVFRRVVDAIDNEWMKLSGKILSKIAFDDQAGATLNDCHWSLPVTFMVQAGIFEMLKVHGIHPSAVVGHSGGEVAAAYAAGAYTLEETCYIVYHRSRIQAKTGGSGRMLVLSMDCESVKETLERLGFKCDSNDNVAPNTVDIACYNSTSNTVVCGSNNVIESLRRKLEDDGLPNGSLIAGNIAFHSRHQMPIREEILDVLGKLDTTHKRTSIVPMISTVTGNFLSKFDSEYWWLNIREPVNFLQAFDTIKRHISPDAILEVSPHITLRSSVRDIYSEGTTTMPTYVYSLLRKSTCSTNFATMIGNCFKAGVPIDFRSLYPFPRPVTHLLPRYAMKRERVIDNLLDDKALYKENLFNEGPLLGTTLRGSNPRYEAIISKQHFPWMADHVVQRSAIVPAASYIECILEAFKGEPVRICKTRFIAPFVLTDEARYLHTEIEPCEHAPHRLDFKITSRLHHSDEPTESTLHCLGTVEKISKDKLDLPCMKEEPQNLSDVEGDFDEVVYENGEDFYSTMISRGDQFGYGPYFQGIQSVYRDANQQRLRVEVAIDNEKWKNWNRMNYVLHPSLLDGALQSSLGLAAESSDFTAVPQTINNFVFLRKPTSGRIVCMYSPPDYLKNFNQKGQLAYGLGEMPAGKLILYDSETGQMVAYLGQLTSFQQNPKKADMDKYKHFVSWQPKEVCMERNAFESTLKKINSGENVAVIADSLIKTIMAEGHPHSGEIFFTNVGEIVVGSEPEKLALDECLSTVTSAPAQYTLVASNTEYLVDTYKRIGSSNKDAHLRFVKNTLETGTGLLRPSIFEVMIIRMNLTKKLATEDKEGAGAPSSAEVKKEESAEEKYELRPEEDLSHLATLVTPGGFILVECFDGALEIPENLQCICRSSSVMLLRAPGITPERKDIKCETLDMESHVVVNDTMGFAKQWRSMKKLSESVVDFGTAATWRRVDYFAMSPEDASSDDPALYHGPLQLVEWVKQFSGQRTGADYVEKCLFTIFTHGAVHDVTCPSQTGIWGAARSLAMELADSCNVEIRLIDLGNKKDLELVNQAEAMREREICVTNGRIWTSRLINNRETMPKVCLSSDDDQAFCLHTDNSGALSGIEFRTKELRPLGEHDVEISLKASALNFRDIMVGLGRLPLDSYERSALGRRLGMECSGIILNCGKSVTRFKPGDKVIAIQGGCIANKIRCSELSAFLLPENLSFEQGASVLSVYITAYYALIHLARMQKRHTVLIHAGMGGVGQAAIALAKLTGATIYATAGSKKKRNALREMGCADVFDSRSTSWYQDLMDATKGEGVDIVLNSLAGEHVDLCLEALTAGGWHCEIGKMDIFKDRPMKMAVFRKNLTYRAIDIDRLMMDDPELSFQLTEEVLEFLRKGIVPPLPLTLYSYANYQNALTCMMNGQHQGKLVLTAPEQGATVDAVDSSPLFDTGTVLISGAFGGLGLRLLAYVIALGAKNVLVLDRDTQRQRSVQWLRQRSFADYLLADASKDTRIEIVQADACKYNDVLRAVNSLSTLGMPPITSVFHLAGILDDKFVKDIDEESFSNVYAPKVNGAWNLHRATRDLESIEHFVMFSSTSAVFGNPGQTNYSAANAFQDGLAEMRRREGKPALSFCIGAVTEVGMAARNAQVLQLLKASGMPAISTMFVIEGLDAALRKGTHSNAVAALATNPPADLSSPDFLRTGGQLVQNADAFQLGGGGALSKDAIIENLSAMLSTLCGVEKIDPTEPVSVYGLNSISVAELIGYLKQEMSFTISAMELMTTASCESIANSIIDARDGGGKESETGISSECYCESANVKKGGNEDIIVFHENGRAPARSRFAPSIYEYFPPGCGLKRTMVKCQSKPKTMADTKTVKTSIEPSKKQDNYLGRLDGSLPPQCQEALDELVSFVHSFDVSKTEPPTPVERMRKFLLTGATGFIGRHFLSELLNSPDAIVDTVYLPVRAQDDDKALKRVIDAMEEVGLWRECYRSKLYAFSANNQEECFGKEPEFYDQLVNDVDGVYHFASDLNLTAPFSQIRKSNCNSMQTIFGLCMTKRRKHLFLASTLGIFPQYVCHFADDMAEIGIDRDMMPNVAMMKRTFPLFQAGYNWSKLVIELAAFEMMKYKDVPLAVFRLPTTFTNSSTGYTVSTDPNLQMLMAILQTRTLPGESFRFDLDDAHACNLIMLRVSLNPHRRNVVYHCTRLNPTLYSECSLFDMMGYPVEVQNYAGFKATCQKLGNKSTISKYWPFIDHFAPYWFSTKHRAYSYPMDISTVEEDCFPVPERTDMLRTMSICMDWIHRNESKWPFDTTILKASNEIETIMVPARKLCQQYNIDLQEVVPLRVYEGLRRICDEVNARELMKTTVTFDLVSRLENRVHMYRLLKMYPEIEQEKVTSPLFILGLNRTGTTFLHRMLEASGHFEAVHFEDMACLPKAEQLASPDKLVAQERIKFLKDALKDTASRLEGVHVLELGVAEEDMCAHSCSFHSLEFDELYHLPQYRQWLEEQSFDEVYVEHKKWIQLISWARRRANPNNKTMADERWALKLPWHARHLKSLVKVYPDARFVHTHRKVEQAAPSLCSLVHRLQTRIKDVDPNEVGRAQVEIFEQQLSAVVEFRKAFPEYKGCWLDVQFENLISAPVDVATQVMAHAGVRVEDSTKQQISRFIEEGKTKLSTIKRHEYKLSDYGIDPKVFEEGKFREYAEMHTDEYRMEEMPEM